MKNTKARIALVVHLLTAFVLLLKGIDKITHHYLVSGVTLLVLAVVILVLLLLEKRSHLSHHMLKQACLWIESLALFIVAYVYYDEGKLYLPYVFAACAAVYFVVAIVHATKEKESVH